MKREEMALWNFSNIWLKFVWDLICTWKEIKLIWNFCNIWLKTVSDEEGGDGEVGDLSQLGTWRTQGRRGGGEPNSERWRGRRQRGRWVRPLCLAMCIEEKGEIRKREEESENEDDMWGPRGPSILLLFSSVTDMWVLWFLFFFGSNCHVSATSMPHGTKI